MTSQLRDGKKGGDHVSFVVRKSLRSTAQLAAELERRSVPRLGEARSFREGQVWTLRKDKLWFVGGVANPSLFDEWLVCRVVSDPEGSRIVGEFRRPSGSAAAGWVAKALHLGAYGIPFIGLIYGLVVLPPALRPRLVLGALFLAAFFILGIRLTLPVSRLRHPSPEEKRRRRALTIEALLRALGEEALEP